ncbi:hypothetical protein [Microvirga flavescens]|uniref:hypothetical protein n=1 Tax=Microvirga flavescens TaxID=2249811 RepID=UPI000DD8868B|nr:hypothetical protein [Microvirga flavescens]
MKRHLILTAILASAGLLVHMQPAAALTMQECSAKYKAAQSAGTLGSMRWNDFRKAECGVGATTAPATTGSTAPSAQQKTPVAPAPMSNATFPSAVSSKYSSESPGKARMHTCLDQYKANQAAGGAANAGLKWIQKGGGYYSQCNTRLKGG